MRIQTDGSGDSGAAAPMSHVLLEYCLGRAGTTSDGRFFQRLDFIQIDRLK
jgi:hypothetical protein